MAPARVDSRSLHGQFPHHNVRHGGIRAAKAYDFKVLLERDETGGYVATCPSLPGCYGRGTRSTERCTNIREAIELCPEDVG